MCAIIRLFLTLLLQLYIISSVNVDVRLEEQFIRYMSDNVFLPQGFPSETVEFHQGTDLDYNIR